MTDPEQEKRELVHPPVPGYRTAFYIIVTVAALYLVWILGTSLQRG